ARAPVPLVVPRPNPGRPGRRDAAPDALPPRHQPHAAQPDAAGDAVGLLAPLSQLRVPALRRPAPRIAVGPAQALVLDGRPAALTGLCRGAALEPALPHARSAPHGLPDPHGAAAHRG